MKSLNVFTSLFVLAGCGICLMASADPTVITVHVDKPGAKLNSDFYGLMTEEINHSYDGGLYAELIQNRSFKDDPNTPVHWSVIPSVSAVGSLSLSDNDPAAPALNKTLELNIKSVPVGGTVGAANDGFWGLPVKPRTAYNASFFAEATNGFTGPLTVSLESADGHTVYAAAQVPALSAGWQQYNLQLKTGRITASTNNRFVIYGFHPGTVRLSLVSLFPPTYNNRPNGNRIDLMETLGALKPGFLRFPGGNFVDPGHYEWKKTIGPLSSRPGGDGAWNYHVSDGLGILEFFEWCEDLNMQPVLDVTDGRGWLPGNGDVAPLVQDALDEIEYATGGPDTVWGAKRIAGGHTAPFPLHYVEIGNEDFFDNLDVYNARFAPFFDAIRAKYPNLLIIATRGDITSRVPDMVDDHYYHNPQEMEAMSTHYDNYNRKGPKIFVGEWRTSEAEHLVTMNDALGDAAWMTGLERNADVVQLECYAPLLFNVNPAAYNTPVNEIGYDSMSVFGTPSYYMQKMFALGHGDTVLPIEVAAAQQSTTPAPISSGGVGVGTFRGNVEFRNVKVAHGDAVLYQEAAGASFVGWKPYFGDWSSADGVLSQAGTIRDCYTATAAGSKWTDYSYSVEARKVSGEGGLSVFVHFNDPENFVRWEIGGRENRESGIDDMSNGFVQPLGHHVRVSIENGRWYTMRVDVIGRDMKFYLDGNLLDEVIDTPGHPEKTVFASATKDSSSGAVWLHLVNTAAFAQPVRLDLTGSPRVDSTAAGQILKSDAASYNSITNPTLVVPQKLTIKHVSHSFVYTLPANSVAVIDIGIQQ